MANEFRIKHALIINNSVSIDNITTGNTLTNNNNSLVTENAIKTYVNNVFNSSTTTSWFNDNIFLGNQTAVTFNSGLSATINNDKIEINLNEFIIDTVITSSSTSTLISEIEVDINKTTIIDSYITAYGDGGKAGYHYSLVVTRNSTTTSIELENEIFSYDTFNWFNNGYTSTVNSTTNKVEIYIKSDNSNNITWQHKYKKI